MSKKAHDILDKMEVLIDDMGYTTDVRELHNALYALDRYTKEVKLEIPEAPVHPFNQKHYFLDRENGDVYVTYQGHVYFRDVELQLPFTDVSHIWDVAEICEANEFYALEEGHELIGNGLEL